MANKVVKGRLMPWCMTVSEWESQDPVLLAGEMGLESETGRHKIGDGGTAWNLLPYPSVSIAGAAPANATLTDDAADRTLPATVSTTLASLLQMTRNCLKWLVARFDSSGSANSAVKLSTARSVGLGGDATGSASFDGTSNVTIPAALVSVATAGTTGESANKTLAFGGTFIAPEITIDAKGRTTTVTGRTMTMPVTPTSVSGNAGTATKLATARALNVSGDVTGTAQSFDGSAAVTIPTSLVAITRADTASAAAPAAGATFTALDTLTTDSKGRVTAANVKTVTLPSAQTSVSGNAGTATKLATARNIALTGDATGSASFDGSASASIATTLITVATAGTTGETAAKTLAFGGAFTVPQLTINAKGLTTAVNGRVMTMPATPTTVSGNAGTATKLATARSIALTGDATGSASFDGSANASIATTLASSGVTAGAIGETANKTLAYGGTFITPQVTVDAKGRTTALTARTMTMPATPTSVTGNAGTATKLATARAISLTGDATGTANFDGSAAASIATTLATVATAGTTGETAAKTLAFGGTFTVPQLTINAKGLTTAVNGRVMTMPATPTSVSGNAGTATTLATARTIQTNLASTSAASFNGSANITPGVTGTLPIANGGTGNTTGLAASATKLATARTINGVSFNGTANITVADSTKLPLAGGTMTGRVIGASLRGSWISSVTTNAAIYVPPNTDTSSSAQGVLAWRSGNGDGFAIANINNGSASQIVYATKANIDAGTNTVTNIATLSAGKFDINGNAATATKLATARTINGVAFDGTANITVADSTKLPLAGGTMTGDIRYNISGSTTSARVPLQFLIGDTNGDGIVLGNAGGLLALSAGEAFATYQNNATTPLVGSTEDVCLLADTRVTLVTGLQTFANRGAIRVTNDGMFPHTAESTRAQNLGSSSEKWNNVYATTFNGALTGNSSTATTLATARTIQTNLASTSSASFNGSANVTPGVTGTLPIANGGTGNTTGLAASATKLATARTLRANLASTSTASFDGTANITPGVTGVLPIANGGTGGDTALAARNALGVRILTGGVERGDVSAGTVYSYPITFPAGVFTSMPRVFVTEQNSQPQNTRLSVSGPSTTSATIRLYSTVTTSGGTLHWLAIQ